jgi:hypothetical protein
MLSLCSSYIKIYLAHPNRLNEHDGPSITP